MPVHSRLATPSAFATAKTKRKPVQYGDPKYQEDFFAMQFYNGGTAAKQINNDIDNENKGGLILIKQAGPGGGGRSMVWMDSLMGTGKYTTVGTGAPTVEAQSLTHLNTNGFTVGNHELYHGTCCRYMSYNFAGEEKFFTLLQYTGNGAASQEIAHNLNGEVGMIIIKAQSGSNGWPVYHRGMNLGVNPEQYNTYLNSNTVSNQETGFWNDTAPTNTHFTVGNHSNVNASGVTYNAYIFGHNEQPEDCVFGPERNKPMIYCGWSPDSSQLGIEQNIGMPVQMLMMKTSISPGFEDAQADSWRIIDKMRGMNMYHHDSPWFTMNGAYADVYESSNSRIMGGNSARGFIPGSQMGPNGKGFIYVAIGDSSYRNASEYSSPTATISTVYQTVMQNDPGNLWTIGNAYKRSLDFLIAKRLSNTQGGNGTDAGQTFMTNRFYSNKWYAHWNQSTWGEWSNNQGSNINRGRSDGGYYRMAGTTNGAPGTIYGGDGLAANTGYFWGMALNVHRKFFDTQNFYSISTGTRTVYHNLEAPPAMIMINSSNSEGWTVYHKDLGVDYMLSLQLTTGKVAGPSGLQGSITSVTPTSVTMTSGTMTFTASESVTMYLFAEYPGWSKIGSYTGTGNQIDIDCGLTYGTPAGGLGNVLIKRVDAGSTGDWMMWNSSYSNIGETGSSAYMKMNVKGDQYNAWSTSYINALVTNNVVTGLRITNAGSNPVNVSGAEYIYWVMAGQS